MENKFSSEVFDSMKKVHSRFENAAFLSTHPSRKKALTHYFARRGVVQLDTTSIPPSWPRLVYPTQEKLERDIVIIERKYREVLDKRQRWKSTHDKASNHEWVSHVQKVVDPLYWKHVGKKVVDSQYRADAKDVDLHSNLIADAKYRPMVEAFVNNDQYRKQLTETVKHSPAYRNHQGLARHAEEKRKLQMDVSKSWLGKAETQVKELEDELFALKELLKWGKEGTGE